MFPCSTRHPFAPLHVQPVRFTNLRYFFSQLSDALFDGRLHEDRLAEHAGRITLLGYFHSLTGALRKNADCDRQPLNADRV